MPVHDEVLRTAQRLCAERQGWTFSAEEVVRALAHLNESSVRAHVSSRCCVNAPVNFSHRWPYFRRVARGRYEILPSFRSKPGSAARGGASRAAESAPRYGRTSRVPRRETIHAVLRRDERHYVAECLEVAVVTQGNTADEVLANLGAAIALHLEGEDMAALGLVDAPRVVVTLELPVHGRGATP